MKYQSIIYLVAVFIVLASCGRDGRQTTTLSSEPASQDTLIYESEDEEEARLDKEQYLSDSLVYSELFVYDGAYFLDTESEGVEGVLELIYRGDKTFEFTLQMTAPIVPCKAEIKGTIYMDQTQHGFYKGEGCFLHLNFMGSWGGNLLIEVEQEDSCNEMNGECVLGGRYMKGDD